MKTRPRVRGIPGVVRAPSVHMGSPSAKARRLVVAVSALCFVASLPMPALLFAHDPPVKGITTLLWGWWGLVKGDFPWFANPLYAAALALVLTGHFKTSLLPSA